MSQPARIRPNLRLLSRKEPSETDPSEGQREPGGPLAQLPDAELVALGIQGNRKALELLYRRHAPFAINLAARIQGSTQDVDDVAHDAFLKAFEKLRELNNPAAFRTWLGSIIVHDVRSRLRRVKLMRTLGLLRSSDAIDLDALASSHASPSVRAQLAQVYALLRTLPVDDRVAWILRAVEGENLESVALLTSCSMATIKRRVARVQNFLDDHFIDSHTEEGEP